MNNCQFILFKTFINLFIYSFNQLTLNYVFTYLINYWIMYFIHVFWQSRPSINNQLVQAELGGKSVCLAKISANILDQLNNQISVLLLVLKVPYWLGSLENITLRDHIIDNAILFILIHLACTQWSNEWRIFVFTLEVMGEEIWFFAQWIPICPVCPVWETPPWSSINDTTGNLSNRLSL